MTEFLNTLIAAATATDGQPPFSDQSLVDLDNGRRQLLTVGDKQGAALVTTTVDEIEAELVVHPDARCRGLGDRLLQDVLQRTKGTVLVWAHGDHPGARALAAKHGLEPVRELLQLRAAVAAAPPEHASSPELVEGQAHKTPSTSSGNGSGSASGTTVRAFRPGADDAAWLELNARAFVGHPEQGKLTQHDLDARKAESWFDATDLLLLEDASAALVGFCWMKVDGELGEFYAVGVDPNHQGAGLGRVLVEAGLGRLAEHGIRESNLYVEADNEPAVRLYRSYGFTKYAVDVQYRRESARSGE